MSAIRLNDPQHGFSIVSAIFLLVVLSALGAFMLTFSSVQQITSAQDLQGDEAYQAAHAGIEYDTYQILQNSGTCVASTPLALAGNLSGFTITVNCKVYGPYTEGVNPVHLYQITATANIGALGSTTYVERRLQATIAN